MTREELERAALRELPLGSMSRPDAERIARAIVALVVEACADVAWLAHLVPPDGGSPTEAERRVAQAAHDNIKAAFLPTPTKESDRG